MTLDLPFALRVCNWDPAREARLYREWAEHARILGDEAECRRAEDLAIEWERATEECRAAGMELRGESAGRTA